ncbi:hypothetical protein [uncultured Sulfitobacter sp.]|uniref:hypothetical protein n=1 Tax=uncultured Sulfitobacter sp. TaxID=191468 RepID=UPI00259A781B|nr:hypothetical protein [uncultured Sulfitobacter sp.]
MQIGKFKFPVEGLLVVVVFAIFSGLGLWVVKSFPDRSPVSASPKLQEQTKEVCEEKIVHSLSGSRRSTDKTSIGDSEFVWKITSYGNEITADAKVNSHNIFGALLASSWSCKAQLVSQRIQFVSLTEN